MTIAIAPHRFTVADYHKMGEAGILNEDDRVELIDGAIVDMTPIGWGHLATVDRLNDLFVRGLGDQVIVRVQGSIQLHELSEPQPDLVLLRRRTDFYATRAAGPADTLLVIEVADSSLRYDREVKVPLYARAGVLEVWLVDLQDKSITAYREPGAEGYRQVVVARGSDPLSPEAFAEFVLSAEQILS